MADLKYFNLSEFDCQHTGRNRMDPLFLARLDKLREVCGFPFVITSGYRDPTHPIEAKKERPGTHSQGIAADIRVSSGAQRYTIISEAIKMGFAGIGVANGFVHVDDRKGAGTAWVY